MCGIVGYIGKEKAIPVLINGLLSLEYRGYDSAGVAVLNEKTNGKVDIEVIKTKGKVEKLKEKLKSIDNIEQNSNIGIAHTRWATHGKPSEKNAHPQLDNSKTFAVVHNGIIENYDELKNMLINKGYKFFSETDTEIIPNLLHYYFIEFLQSEGTKRGIYNKEKKISEQINNKEIEKIYSEIYLKAISKTVKTLQGSFALGIITNLFPKKLIAIKKDTG